ncbi:IMPACT family protein [Arcanobacterium pinnipediorum]|uniref:IMPACT family protein n=1 Tax=Arcanobacterium pinnipediorum TaxID=1503041 RepID=A0ABY5AHY9_9ACTO|nr:YigZ family protein [Arcanobacterium pinnipediorum]USR79820.1 IMPACT family protein [Arcanobacterium pinnipediorum]
MTTLLRLPAGTELRSELEIKRSRFITLIRRVESLHSARDLLAQARAEFPDARHHCSAYIVSVAGAQPLNHSSDDGEPSGTAGRPMLDVLLGANLTDIAAVVVRYFGGTLLGTGGLVRAYSDSVRNCLTGVELVSPVTRSVQRITLPHSWAGKFDADARTRGYDVIDTLYEHSGVTFRVAVSDVEQFAVYVSEITKGARTAQPDGVVVLDIPAGTLTL